MNPLLGSVVLAPTARSVAAQSLLLDGQQHITSLYQVTIRGEVIETVTPKKKRVKRWFYLDIRKALDPLIDREEAVIGVPEDRVVRADFGRGAVLDLSSPEKEYAELMYPLCQVFDWDKWQDGFDEHWSNDVNRPMRQTFREFKNQVLDNFKYYRIPVIALDKSTPKEAVCVVFEKVNTGGGALQRKLAREFLVAPAMVGYALTGKGRHESATRGTANMVGRWLSVAEIATDLGVSKGSIDRWLDDRSSRP